MIAYKKIFPLCIVCFEEAVVIYEGTTMCEEHFELLFKDRYGVKKMTDKKSWGRSLKQMKGYEK